MENIFEKSLVAHEKSKWKIETTLKVQANDQNDLSIYYSPWVAAPCLEIQKDPKKAYDYTRKWNVVAVISDGSAVLWLGNIWGLAGLPVMEWKAMLFKKFAWVDCVPIVLNTQNPDEIINIVKAISPSFGWINLEDISAPNCFYIEETLKKDLDIPVFHDDQHWTAIVALAGLINSLKLVEKNIENIKIVMIWAWAAGIAIAKLLEKFWAKNIVMVDSKWVINSQREDLNKYKKDISRLNIENISWNLDDAIVGTDVFIGVGVAESLKPSMIEKMWTKPIIFALANPIPEIMPDLAKQAWAYIVATWRSDFPNQINNVLAFPGLFRWILDSRQTKITDEHKIAAALALANMVKNPSIENILPLASDENVAKVVAEAVKKAN